MLPARSPRSPAFKPGSTGVLLCLWMIVVVWSIFLTVHAHPIFFGLMIFVLAFGGVVVFGNRSNSHEELKKHIVVYKPLKSLKNCESNNNTNSVNGEALNGNSNDDEDFIDIDLEEEDDW